MRGRGIINRSEKLPAALTPCPSPLAKSAPEEGSVLNFLREIT